jgi:general secretion pathway protein D
VVSSKIVTVVPDTANKRKEYEPEPVVKTIFLSNADPRPAVDLLRVALGAKRVAPVLEPPAVTITDTPDRVAAAEHILSVIDKKRAEVVVEVELLEVNRNRLRDYGVEITSNAATGGGGGISGSAFPSPLKLGVDEAGRVVTQGPLTLDDNPYKSSNILITSLPGVIYRLLRNDASTRLLATPRLRTSEGQTAQARFGDQIPVPVTTFTPLAVGTLNQQPITSFEYKSVGVNIDITPRVHADGDVSLELKLDISALAPSLDVAGVQGLPTFNSRTVTSRLRLRAGETSVLAGLISDTERRSMAGVAGLSDLPFIGALFARHRREINQTDIIMTLRPHIVSQPQITEDDLRAFVLANESPALLFEVAPAGSAPTPIPARIGEPLRVEPIRPPNPTPTPLPYR